MARPLGSAGARRRANEPSAGISQATRQHSPGLDLTLSSAFAQVMSLPILARYAFCFVPTADPSVTLLMHSISSSDLPASIAGWSRRSSSTANKACGENASREERNTNASQRRKLWLAGHSQPPWQSKGHTATGTGIYWRRYRRRGPARPRGYYGMHTEIYARGLQTCAAVIGVSAVWKRVIR